MKKVMIFTYSLGRGGSELNAYKCTKILDRHMFDWYCLNFDSVDIMNLLQDSKNIKQIVNLNFKSLTNIDFLIHLSRVIKERKYTTIYAVGFMPSLIVSIVKLVFGIKIKLVTTRREMMPWKSFYHTPFIRLINYASNNIETNSKTIINNLKSELFTHNKVYFVPNIILKSNTQKKMKFFLNSKRYVGTVANVRKAKNIHLFLKIAQYVIKNNKDIVFMIAGKDKDGMVSKFIESNDLSNQLFIYEDIDFDNISKFYSGLDVFLFTSIYEGSPNVIYEAMSNGIPIVSSNIPAVRELVVNGSNGYLVELNNFDGFVSKIETILYDDSLRLRIIESNKKKSKELTLPDSIKFILEDVFI